MKERFLYNMFFFSIAYGISFLFLGNFTPYVYAEKVMPEKKVQKSAKDLDVETTEEETEEESEAEWEFSGFIKAQALVNTYKNQEKKDANKKDEIRKNFRCKMKYEFFEFNMNMNAYVNANIINEGYNKEYRYAEELKVRRNMRVSDKAYEFNFNELYMGLSSERVRIRAGNQIFAWGTADAYNPTSYFNPMESRDMMFRDEDDMKIAVPAVSTMIFMGDITFEAVFVPVHVPSYYAPEGNFWAIKYRQGPFPVNAKEPEALDIAPVNYGYGGKLSGNFGGADISISGYHGPDIEPAMKPIGTSIIPNEPVSLVVQPEYFVTNYGGIALSKNIGKFVFQAEAAFSPDKTGVVDQGDTEDIEDPEVLIFPFEVKKTKFVSYSAGFNVFIPLEKIIEGHDGESVFTFEWHEAKFLDSGLLPPVISRIIIARYDDTYLGNSLKVALMGIYDPDNKAMIAVPKLGYDFQNGFSLHITYGHIKNFNEEKNNGTDISLFSLYKDHNVVIAEAKYEY